MTSKEKPISRTDVLLTSKNCPFITLTETNIPNQWAHDKIKGIFILTANGFKHLNP